MTTPYERVMQRYGLMREEEAVAAASDTDSRKELHTQLALMAMGLGYDLADSDDFDRFITDVKHAVTTGKAMLSQFAKKTHGSRAKKAVLTLKKSI